MQAAQVSLCLRKQHPMPSQTTSYAALRGMVVMHIPEFGIGVEVNAALEDAESSKESHWEMDEARKRNRRQPHQVRKLWSIRGLRHFRLSGALAFGVPLPTRPLPWLLRS